MSGVVTLIDFYCINERWWNNSTGSAKREEKWDSDETYLLFLISFEM